MTINIESEAWCRKAYLNYHCYNNTMGISASEMAEITQTWSGQLSSWQASVSNDQTEYEFDDSDYSSYKANGKQIAEDETGFDADKTRGQDCRVVVDSATGVAGVGVAVAASVDMASKSTSNFTSTKGGSIAMCAIALAKAIYYKANKPNEDEHQASQDVVDVLANGANDLAATQEEMEAMSEELVELSDEATENNEDANEEIEEEKTKYDMYKRSYEALKAKVDSGQTLTSDEQSLYKDVVSNMNEAGENITGIQEDTTDVVQDIYSDMETYQDGYDYAAETMGEVEGVTDYAASFDNKTKNDCAVEQYAQGANVLLGTTGAIQAARKAAGMGWLGAIWWAAAAAGLTAAGLSTAAAAEQGKWASEVGAEIDQRLDTQDLNSDTMDMYTEEVDTYAGFMQNVEELEVAIPDDVETVEDTSAGTTTAGTTAGTTTSTTTGSQSATDTTSSTSTTSKDNDDKDDKLNGGGVEFSKSNSSNGYANYVDILYGKVVDDSEVVYGNNNRVQVSTQYASAIATVLGESAATSGGKFNTKLIPAMIAEMIPGTDAQTISRVMNNKRLSSSYSATEIGTLSEETKASVTVNNGKTYAENLQTLIKFYGKIFTSAANNGWSV